MTSKLVQLESFLLWELWIDQYPIGRFSGSKCIDGEVFWIFRPHKHLSQCSIRLINQAIDMLYVMDTEKLKSTKFLHFA